MTLMNVYFDKLGNISAITPVIDNSAGKDLLHTSFPLSEVEHFLNGSQSLSNYFIKSIKLKGETKYKIEKIPTKISYVRTLDNYLEKIEKISSEKIVISIKNSIKDKNITVELIGNLEEDITDEEVEEFMNRLNSEIYITEKNNPYILLHTLNFSPRILFNNKKIFFENVICRNTSAYTKKFIKGYTYEEKE